MISTRSVLRSDLFEKAALHKLFEQGNELYAFMIRFKKSDRLRQLAERVLLLSQQLTLSAIGDHVRNEQLMRCYLELRAALIKRHRKTKLSPATEGMRQRPSRAALEQETAEYLAQVLLLAGSSVADQTDYSVRWCASLVAAYRDLRRLVRIPTQRALLLAKRGIIYPRHAQGDTQQAQVVELAQNPYYAAFPPPAQSETGQAETYFFLAPLLLVGIGYDGTRFDFCLYGLVTEDTELPSLKRCPVADDLASLFTSETDSASVKANANANAKAKANEIAGEDENFPTVTYTDRGGRQRQLVYNPQLLTYQLLLAPVHD